MKNITKKRAEFFQSILNKTSWILLILFYIGLYLQFKNVLIINIFLVLLILIPFLSILNLIYSRGYINFEKDDHGPSQPFIVHFFTIYFFNYAMFNLMEYKILIFISIFISLLFSITFFIFCKKNNKRFGVLFLSIFLLIPYFYSSISVVNNVFAVNSNYEFIQEKIILKVDHHHSGGRGGAPDTQEFIFNEYELIKKVKVSKFLYSSFKEGDFVNIIVKKGLLGFHYYHVDICNAH